MNIWPQFLQSLLLMLMLSQFGFGMDDGQPRKTTRLLNPNATPFYPGVKFIHSQSKHQITSEDIKHEDLPNLPDYLFDWEDKIDDNRKEREEGGNSLNVDINPRERKEATTSQDEGTHLAPNPKLGEGENPSEVGEIKIDSVQQEAKRTMKFGSFPEILLTGEKKIDELNKLLGQKDQKKDQLLTSKTDKSKSSTSFKSEKEKNHPHSQSIEKQKAEEEERKTQEVAQLEHQNTAKLELELNRKIALGGKEEIKSTASSKSSDIISNKKMLEGESILSTDKAMSAKSLQKSSTSSSRAKEKQQHPHQKAQPTNPAGDNNIPRGSSGSISSSHSHSIHKQSTSKIEQKFTPTVKTISPRIMEEKTAEDSLVKTSEIGENLMDHEEFVEEIKYDQLRTDQTTKELIEEKIVNDEQTGKPESTNQDQRSRQTGQSSKGKSRKNRPTAQLSKGKNVITSLEKEAEILKKEEEENELLHQFKKVADEERLKIEKQKQTEIEKRIKEKLKMYEEKEEQSRKQMLDNIMGGTDKSVKISDFSTTATSASDSTITNVVVQGHGETSGSYGTVGGDIVNETFLQPNAVISAPADASFCVKGEKKFKQIKDLLKKMNENLKELKLLEKEWIEEKSKKNVSKLNHEINKEKKILKNLKQYESSKVQFIIEVNKFERMINNFDELKNQKYLKKKNLENREKLLKVMRENMKKQKEMIVNLEKEIDQLINLLIEKFIKMNWPETEEIKTIEKKMEEPMRNLWNLYNLVLLALNQIWHEPGFRKHYGFVLPYHYIDYIFYNTPLSIREEDQSEFDNTMKRSLEKMLLHQNIYRTMNLETKVNGKSASIFERLNCFDELSEKMNLQDAADGEEFSETNLEFLMKFGKYIKEQVNKHIREAFRFIMVGLDEVPDVSDQMALDGIKRLSLNWLPQNRKRQMDEIWMRLFKYYDIENKNLNILSHEVHDDWAHKVFDLMPKDKEEQNIQNIRKQLSKIDELNIEISEEFSKQIITFMKNVVFNNIEQFIHSVIMLVKIEKRMNDAKPLPYLKSVYDKYWYKIYKNRFFNIYFTQHVYQYHFARGINHTERVKNINKLLAKAPMDKNTNMKQIFRQIAHVKPDILDEMMKVIDTIDAFVNENKIVYRLQKYKNDEDFMKSVADENPNLDYFESFEKLNAE